VSGCQVMFGDYVSPCLCLLSDMSAIMNIRCLRTPTRPYRSPTWPNRPLWFPQVPLSSINRSAYFLEFTIGLKINICVASFLVVVGKYLNPIVTIEMRGQQPSHLLNPHSTNTQEHRGLAILCGTWNFKRCLMLYSVGALYPCAAWFSLYGLRTIVLFQVILV